MYLSARTSRYPIMKMAGNSAVRGKLRQRTVSLHRSMSYGLFCPGTIGNPEAANGRLSGASRRGAMGDEPYMLLDPQGNNSHVYPHYCRQSA